MLRMNRMDFQMMIDHCRKGLPDEACGMLGGRDGKVAMVFPMTNAKPSPDYYEMDPSEQFRVMKGIRESGLQLIGLFHSHPYGEAYPSSVDVRNAYWPGTELPNYPESVYVIISFKDSTRPEPRGFRIEEGKVDEVEIVIE